MSKLPKQTQAHTDLGGLTFLQVFLGAADQGHTGQDLFVYRAAAVRRQRYSTCRWRTEVFRNYTVVTPVPACDVIESGQNRLHSAISISSVGQCHTHRFIERPQWMIVAQNRHRKSQFVALNDGLR